MALIVSNDREHSVRNNQRIVTRHSGQHQTVNRLPWTNRSTSGSRSSSSCNSRS